VIEGDGSAAEEDQCEGQGGQGEREFVTVLAHQSVVPVNFCDGDRHIDADSEGGGAGEEADQQEQSAEEFREGGEIAGPGGQTKAMNELGVVLQAAEHFVVSVADHDGAQSEAHD